MRGIARFVDGFLSVLCGVTLFPCAACSWFARWPCLALLAFVVTSIRVALFARRPACLRPPVRAACIAARFTSRGRGVSFRYLLWAVALALPACSGCVALHCVSLAFLPALLPAQAWTRVPPFEPARSPG
jgi:hypothetical protein